MPYETYPSIYPSGLVFRLTPFTQVFVSPLTQQAQTSELPGTSWRAVLSYNALSDANALLLEAFVEALNGVAGRFYLWDMAHENPKGVGTGTPLVKTLALAGAKIMYTKGWTISQTGILLKGDKFAVNDELKRMTANANSDGAGDATLNFTPALRKNAAIDLPLTVIKPKCVMRLLDDNQGGMTWRPGIYAEGITIECVEAFE